MTYDDAGGDAALDRDGNTSDIDAAATDAAADAPIDAAPCVGTCGPTADGCCPQGCNANDDADCTPFCGNGVTETGELCDGPKCPTACPDEVLGCFTSTGAAETCNLTCHIPVTACGGGDACCPYQSGGGTCNVNVDSDCGGFSWQSTGWYRPTTFTATQPCDVLNVYGIVVGASYLFTTCAPPGTAAGTGDSVITSVVDNTGRSYPVANDDCGDPSSLPVLAGWSCNNATGIVRMSCAAPTTGGFIALPSADGTEVYRMDVTICPFGDVPASNGTAPFFVWWNGQGSPNPG